MRTAVLGWFLGAVLAHAEPLTCVEVKVSDAKVPLPAPIRLRAERTKLTLPESHADMREIGMGGFIRAGSMAGEEAGDYVSIYRVSDGMVYLVDRLSMALWILEDGRWNCVLHGVRVDKTFGGAFPFLPISYVGNKRFVVTETVPGKVKELSPEEPHLPQALAVTFLIDSKESRVLARGPAFRYSENPPAKVPEDWKGKFGLLEVKWLKSDGK